MNASATGAPPASAMFGDAQAMKEEMYANIDQKDYDVADFYHETGCCQAIARSDLFGTLTLAVISINAIWIGVDSDHNDATTLAQADLHFQIAEHSFCTFFSFEWGVRFLSFAQKKNCLRDHWFKFDTVLVVLMVSETWIIPLATSGSGGSAMGNMSLFKMLRLLRLTRMVRIMRALPELMTMLKGMAAASRAVGATFTLLTIVMYVFGIIFATQLHDNDVLSEEWGTIPKAMWMLLLYGTFLDDMTDCAEAVRDNSHPLFICLFLAFVLISSVTILNMLVGVLCEVVAAVAEAEKGKAVITYVKSTLIDILTELDTDGTGTISKDEFAVLLEVPSAVDALEQLGVDVANLLMLADVLFDGDCGTRPNAKSSQHSQLSQRTMTSGLDPHVSSASMAASSSFHPAEQQPGVELPFNELLEMIIRLRSENVASVPDIVDLRKFIRWSSNQQSEVLKELRRDVNATNRSMQAHMKNIDVKLEALVHKTKKKCKKKICGTSLCSQCKKEIDH